MWERNATLNCLNYYFTATNANGTYRRLPETGFYQTGRIEICKGNWVQSI
jgi:hypothetical protein